MSDGDQDARVYRLVPRSERPEPSGTRAYLVAYFAADGTNFANHQLLDVDATSPHEAATVAGGQLGDGYVVTDVYEHVFTTPQGDPAGGCDELPRVAAAATGGRVMWTWTFEDEERLARLSEEYRQHSGRSNDFAGLAEEADALARGYEDAAEHYRQRAERWREIARFKD